jgi:hypothetical protein
VTHGVLFLGELSEVSRRDALKEGEWSPNADWYETICEFFGWPDARRRSFI